MLEIYLLTHSAAYLACVIIASAYAFSYPLIKAVTENEIPETDHDRSAEFSPSERLGIMKKSQLFYVLNIILVTILVCVNETIRLLREADGSKDPAFYKMVIPNSQEDKDEYI